MSLLSLLRRLHARLARALNQPPVLIVPLPDEHGAFAYNYLTPDDWTPPRTGGVRFSQKEG